MFNCRAIYVWSQDLGALQIPKCRKFRLSPISHVLCKAVTSGTFLVRTSILLPSSVWFAYH
jgi:hypothetical protein